MKTIKVLYAVFMALCSLAIIGLALFADINITWDTTTVVIFTLLPTLGMYAAAHTFYYLNRAS